jgi:hypothetical protein
VFDHDEPEKQGKQGILGANKGILGAKSGRERKRT